MSGVGKLKAFKRPLGIVGKHYLLFCVPRLPPVKVWRLFTYMGFVCCHPSWDVLLYLHFRESSVEEFLASTSK